ncbi:MAG: hypothetical protein MHM6MM_000037 [Cercozoa sp. M6MM]
MRRPVFALGLLLSATSVASLAEKKNVVEVSPYAAKPPTKLLLQQTADKENFTVVARTSWYMKEMPATVTSCRFTAMPRDDPDVSYAVTAVLDRPGFSDYRADIDNLDILESDSYEVQINCRDADENESEFILHKIGWPLPPATPPNFNVEQYDLGVLRLSWGDLTLIKHADGHGEGLYYNVTWVNTKNPSVVMSRTYDAGTHSGLVEGLNDMDKYRVSVHAVSSAGESDWSVFSLHVEGVPARLEGLHAEWYQNENKMKTNEMHVTWNDIYDEQRGVEVQLRCDKWVEDLENSDEWTSFMGLEQPMRIVGLDDSCNYEVRMRWRGQMAFGDWSESAQVEAIRSNLPPSAGFYTLFVFVIFLGHCFWKHYNVRKQKILEKTPEVSIETDAAQCNSSR